MDRSKAKQFGENIRKIREKKKLTQAEVAKKAGMNTNYFAVIERGEVSTSGENLQKISDALGADISSITKTR